MQSEISEMKNLRETISSGSKSFRWASLFLSPSTQRASYILYRWCRYCDDQIDQAPVLGLAHQRLSQIKLHTQRALTQDESQLPLQFKGLSEIKKEYNIPSELFFDLIKGFEIDVNGNEIETESDLEKYCYHVAGAVGLLMSPILKVKDQNALRYADTLGRAMQVTNICRDIAEDFSNGRVYIPNQWLMEFGINRKELMVAQNREKLWQITLRLLQLADKKYQEGRKGICALPFRAGLSINIASHLYQKIGHKIRRGGPASLESRAMLGLFDKIKATCVGLMDYVVLMINENLKNKKVSVDHG